METVLIAIGTALATGFGQWVFYFRKHRANADRSEIDNLKLIVQEWRDTSKIWKDMADEYQNRHIDNSRKIEQLYEEIASLKRQLDKANRKINDLENNAKH